jgi:hypothetical protein
MDELLKDLSPKEKFKVCLFFTRQVGSCIVEDYPIKDDITNHDFLVYHLNKTKVKNLRASIRRNQKFLMKLLKKENADLEKFSKFKLEMADWHKLLVKQHMYTFTQHTEKEWNSLGLSLHYLFDAYQHIYNRLILMSNQSPNAKCAWCKDKLSRPFNEILSEIITIHLPYCYILYSLAQDQFLGDAKPLLSRTHEHFDNLKNLVQISLENAIIEA